MVDCLKQRKPFFAWLPAILWAFIIFVLSVIPATVYSISRITYFDKIAHFTAYFILAVLILRAFSPGQNLSFKKNYLFTLILGGGYGILLELIQYSIPYRVADVNDCISNVLGLMFGCLLIMLERLLWRK